MTMEFRTEISVGRSPFTVAHDRCGFAAGSCFAEQMAARLEALRFPLTASPTGILFNPASMAAMIRRLDGEQPYAVDELFESGGLWHSYDHHGSFSRPTAGETLRAVNTAFRNGAEGLRRADYVMLTFGTAWIYRLAENGRIVANCHKQPADRFVRERLRPEAIVAEYDALLAGPLAGKQVLLTVSPVRHLKDGLVENSLSKAILRCAAADLAERWPNVWYFPAYELLNDDLRDYRFYAPDMTHPSPQAIDYVWERFVRFAMDDATAALLPRLERLRTALGHRMLHAGSEGEAMFRRRSLALIDELQRALPQLDFSAERHHFGA